MSIKTTNSGGEAALVLADSWGGHSSAIQDKSLSRMGVKLLKIPPSTTDRLQPLDVNFNRQPKIFYNRVIEEAFYEDISFVTSREGILKLHSLLHNQFSSAKYRDMILYAWRHTDSKFDAKREMSKVPPHMANQIQFNFDGDATCERDGC